MEQILQSNDTFRYMMLGRFKADCDGYIDPLDCRYQWTERLWARDEKNHIQNMKDLYNTFSEDKKPQWLTWDQILEYERQMLTIK